LIPEGYCEDLRAFAGLGLCWYGANQLVAVYQSALSHWAIDLDKNGVATLEGAEVRYRDLRVFVGHHSPNQWASVRAEDLGVGVGVGVPWHQENGVCSLDLMVFVHQLEAMVAWASSHCQVNHDQFCDYSLVAMELYFRALVSCPQQAGWVPWEPTEYYR